MQVQVTIDHTLHWHNLEAGNLFRSTKHIPNISLFKQCQMLTLRKYVEKTN